MFKRIVICIRKYSRYKIQSMQIYLYKKIINMPLPNHWIPRQYSRPNFQWPQDITELYLLERQIIFFQSLFLVMGAAAIFILIRTIPGQHLTFQLI